VPGASLNVTLAAIAVDTLSSGVDAQAGERVVRAPTLVPDVTK